jgi:TPR repeat protein
MFPLNLDGNDPHERNRWLQSAAREGYVPAMYDYGLACDDPSQRRYWLEMASEEGNNCATHILGHGT